MTHHDLISSYIDNELTTAQEQEFLISLAANDNLRSSFRTELTLKNIVHRDESLITPPRALRASVFAAVGLSAAATPEVAQAATQTSTQVSTSATVATQSSTFFKTLFATKMNALFTTLSLSVATLVGFVGHDVIVEEPAATQTVQTNNSTPTSTRIAEPTQPASTEVVAEKPMADAKKQTGSRVATRITKKSTKSIPYEAAKPSTVTDGGIDASSSGDVMLPPPVITPQK